MHRESYERNMLLGLIAHQVGFIDLMTLVKSLKKWGVAREVSLGQQLLDDALVDHEEYRLLESLVLKHLARHKEESTVSFNVFHAYGTVCDELRKIEDPAIQEMVETIYQADTPPGQARQGGSQARAGQKGSARYSTQQKQPHAKGGLGEIWIAKDQELHRWVALKAIRKDRPDSPDTRSRLEFEAEVTGNLEHPSIVAVYGLIADTDGSPQYAMRLIRGIDLRSAIYLYHKKRDYREAIDLVYAGMSRDDAEKQVATSGRILDDEAWARERRGLLTKFIAACEAIHYAHERKVLHRDIKPGNFMVGKHGEILVVDWGLAKTAERPDNDPTSVEPDVAETTYFRSSGGTEIASLDNQRVGTPGYLSPEQATSDCVTLGPATDIYSLGATLYAILTGKTPITAPESMNRAHRDFYVFEQTLKGKFRTPREVNSSVPRPLNAIVLKAMALKPEDRYATAIELARDVERWLGGEPVSVDVEPWNERVVRWAKKHQTAVAAAAVLLIASTIGLAIGYGAVRQERDRTEANLDIAIKTIDATLTRLADNGLYNIPEMAEVRRLFAQDAVKFLTSLNTVNSTKSDLNFSLARVYKLQGNLCRGSGDFPSATIAYDAALRLLPERNPIDWFEAAARAETLSERAELLRMSGEPELAIQDHRVALEITKRGMEIEEFRSMFRKIQAMTQGELSDSLGELGRCREAITEVNAAIAMLEKIIGGRRTSRPADLTLGLSLNLTLFHLNAAKYHRLQGEMADARIHLGTAEAMAADQVRELGNRSDAAYLMAICHHEKGCLLAIEGKHLDAKNEFDEAIARAKKLVKLYRYLIEYPRILALIHEDRGASLAMLGEIAEAQNDFVESEKLLGRLLEMNPTHKTFLKQLEGLKTRQDSVR